MSLLNIYHMFSYSLIILFGLFVLMLKLMVYCFQVLGIGGASLCNDGSGISISILLWP